MKETLTSFIYVGGFGEKYKIMLSSFGDLSCDIVVNYTVLHSRTFVVVVSKLS